MMRYQDKLDRLVNGVLRGSGETDTQLRQAVAARAASYSGQADQGGEIPSDLETWIEKVARYAYKTTDEEMDDLKAAGYSEDELFEITIAAALGAAKARLDKAREVLAMTKEVTHEA